jgi:cytochrome c553
MKRTTLFVFSTMMLVIAFSACQTQTEQTFETEWAGEDLQEIISNLESQHGGFDITMIQTSYRYNEIYWAGQDENWGYADYQLHEMLEGLKDGFVRRPEREASSAQFVDQAAPRLLQAIEAGDKTQFLESFNRFASACNTCHTMEEMPFIQVIIPEVRTSLIKF